MKLNIQDRESSWKPVTINLTFETKSELAAFLLLHDDVIVLENVVKTGLSTDTAFQRFNPDIDSIGKILPQVEWSTLNKILEE